MSFERDPQDESSTRVRAWFEAHGWGAVTISCSDEEGLEGWRWSHPDSMIEFEIVGDWGALPPVSDSMREHMLVEIGQ